MKAAPATLLARLKVVAALSVPAHTEIDCAPVSVGPGTTVASTADQALDVEPQLFAAVVAVRLTRKSDQRPDAGLVQVTVRAFPAATAIDNRKCTQNTQVY